MLPTEYRNIRLTILNSITYTLITIGLPETLSTITCSRGILVAFIISEVVYYIS